jgi:sulfate/thiosulfate transport system substrate-binding protein
MVRFTMLRRLLPPALAIALLPVLVAGCGNDSRGGAASGGGSGSKVSLVAYSTPQEAYASLIPAFQKTPDGKGTQFGQSYGPSGDQARAVIAGLNADYVAFSLAPDMDKLVDEGLVAKDWDQNSTKGFVTNSVVSLVVRKGNPKHIKTWDDLLKPGVQVITPNVFTSGAAKWNVMGAYGAAVKSGKSPAEARDYLKKLYGHVPVQPKSGREALQTFVGGKGDVLISYENEALTAQRKGEKVDFVTPDRTLLIQNPAAVVTKGKNAKKAAAFLKFVKTPEAQKIFASKGYRPVVKSLVDPKQFPTPKGLFTIDDLGGWKKVNDEFFDPDNSVVADIEKKLGVSTDG